MGVIDDRENMLKKILRGMLLDAHNMLRTDYTAEGCAAKIEEARELAGTLLTYQKTKGELDQ